MCSPKKVCCFVCYNLFPKTTKSPQCKDCGDFCCPLCNACLCSLSVGEQRVALAMMKTYEPILNSHYDFSVHKKIEKAVTETLVTKKH